VRSVRLVLPDDPAYLAEMADQALAHRRFGPREEQTATYRASGPIELAVRGWLAARVPLLDQRIIAADVLFRDARSYESLFVELDAVQGTDGIPRRVYEVKFTSNAGALRRGFGQLARACRLLEARWGRIETVVVLVQADRGPLPLDDPRLEGVVQVAVADLLSGRPLPDRSLLRVDPGLLAGFLGEEDRALLDLARDESDANVTARLARTAAIERGEELPSRPERPVREGATISFEDVSEPEDELADSPFAALRPLASPPERS
jgi:hypothetical protein